MSKHRGFSLVLCAVIATLVSSAPNAADAWQPAAGDHIAFDILDGDKTVGQLDIRFSRPAADTLVIDRHEDMSVSRMMLKARLEQTSQERRVNNRLTSFSSNTTLTSAIKDAKASVELGRDAKGVLAGKSNEGPLALPADAMPASLWRGDELHDGAYFDAGSGKLLNLSIVAVATSEKTPKQYHGPGCSGRDVSIASKDKKSRALIWVDPAGHICTMRLFTDLGPLEYVPVAVSK